MHELIERAQNGDEKAMASLITENTRLVWSIVKRFQNRGLDADDLFQIGVLGFVKAIKRFDLSCHNQLSTYAVTMMIGEIKRFLRDDGMIRVSRNLKEISIKVRELKEQYFKQKGIELSLTELANLLHITKEEIVLALEATSCMDDWIRVDMRQREDALDDFEYLFDIASASASEMEDGGSTICTDNDDE